MCFVVCLLVMFILRVMNFDLLEFISYVVGSCFVAVWFVKSLLLLLFWVLP